MKSSIKKTISKIKCLFKGVSPLQTNIRETIILRSLERIEGYDEKIYNYYMNDENIRQSIFCGLGWVNGERFAPSARTKFVYYSQSTVARKYDKSAQICMAAKQKDLCFMYVGVVLNSIQNACFGFENLLRAVSNVEIQEKVFSDFQQNETQDETFFETKKALRAKFIFETPQQIVAYASAFLEKTKCKAKTHFCNQDKIQQSEYILQKQLECSVKLCAGYLVGFYNNVYDVSNNDNFDNTHVFEERGE